MVQAKCIQKFRNKQGKIVGYKLQDASNKTLDIKAEELKQAIRENKINIINLKLTDDGRLVNSNNNITPIKLVESTKKVLPTQRMNGKLVCIADGAFYDYKDKSSWVTRLIINSYRVKVDNATGAYSGMRDVEVDLRPYTLYEKELSNNEILVIPDDYVWVYDEVKFIDTGMAHIPWCKINLAVAKKMKDNNGIDILVDVKEEEALNCIRRLSASTLARKAIYMDLRVTNYILNPNKQFNKKALRNITLKDAYYGDDRVEFLSKQLLFLGEGIKYTTEEVDKNTLAYVVCGYGFNWSESYNYLRNCNIRWTDEVPNVYSLDAFVIIMIACTDDSCIGKLIK